MLKQFFKYIFQSIAGMIGISVYILADTFFYIGSFRSGRTGCSESDPSGIWCGICHRSHDRYWFGHPIRDQQGQGGKYGSLFSPVCFLERSVQCAFYHYRDFCTGKNFCIFLAQMQA